MRKGLVELCVLSTLQQGEAYGYLILQRLATVECLSFGESSVYPILARLTQDGFVKVRTAPSPSGPPRRYYCLTPLGRSRLREMRSYWNEVEAAVNRLSDPSATDQKTSQTKPGEATK